MITVVPSAELSFAALPGRLSANPFDKLVGLDAGVAVRIVTMTADPDRTAHVHPQSVEVIYVAAGTGVAWCEDGETRVSPGDLMLVPAGTPHATLPDAGEEMLLICFFPHPDLAANIVELDTGPLQTR